MAMEKDGYRDILEDLLREFEGKRILTVSDVARYTGLTRKTVAKRYPFDKNHTIAIPLLARKMC